MLGQTTDVNTLAPTTTRTKGQGSAVEVVKISLKGYIRKKVVTILKIYLLKKNFFLNSF